MHASIRTGSKGYSVSACNDLFFTLWILVIHMFFSFVDS